MKKNKIQEAPEPISLDEYQEWTGTKEGDHDSRREKHINWSMGIAGEAGEYTGAMKKWLFYGDDYQEDEYKKELGDILFYLARAAAAHGWTLQEVATRNILKLEKRYTDGFTVEASRERDTESE